MLRTPLFTFKNMAEAVRFENWIRANFEKIRCLVCKYSNHAELIEIKYYVIGKLVNLKFIYTTADASGQNMVTYCTWKLCEWINEFFSEETGIAILSFVVDGNGSSDKKVSFYSLMNGRGVHVISECFLTNEVIVKTLRTTAKEMFRLYNHAMAIVRFDGIVGGTMNIANAIAGIFAATGQDLACIHESSVGIIQLDLLDEGLYLSLSVPALVIGTVGGGTQLPGPKVALELMGCFGRGKLERFAKLIAGFALALEISTLAAMASGQFARAHQKLGKNKSVNWLLKSEIDTRFLNRHMNRADRDELASVEWLSTDSLTNGILNDLAARVTRKMIGFLALRVDSLDGASRKVLLKSKPLDEELILGLHFMASCLNTKLADNLLKYRKFLEYTDSHLKEVDVYKYLNSISYPFMPEYFGDIRDEKREIYLFMIEYLEADFMEVINSENNTDIWTDDLIISAIRSIDVVHKAYLNGSNKEHLAYIQRFDVSMGLPFYQECNQVNRQDYREWELDHLFGELSDVMEGWEREPPVKKSKVTLVHNDFNSRNVGLRKNGRVCIYDWELAMINIPQRDVFEFLSFTLDPDFPEDRLRSLMAGHFDLIRDINGNEYGWNDYIDDFTLSGYEFLITRASFYLAGNTLLNYPFIKRVFITSNRIISNARSFYERD
jgi:hydroxymethylglutaryl-CoA reductase (NADPH)